MATKNFAFISYNHKDVKWGNWLQKKLESYKLPSEIHNEFEDSKYIRPIFRDQTDLNTGILANTLRDNLENSKFLIVLCSPNSAQSEWCSKEVETFIKWGRIEQIIPLIVDGQPNCYNPDLECFPRYLREYVKEHPDQELLGVSIAEVGKEKAFIRVVSRMLDVSFDTLWKRHERERRRRIFMTVLSSLLLLVALYWLAIPYTLNINVKDAAHQLPVPANEHGTKGWVIVDEIWHPIENLDTTLVINDLPGYRRLTNVAVAFQGYDFRDDTTSVKKSYYVPQSFSQTLGWGVSTDIDICLERDNTFGLFAGTVLGEVVDGNRLTIAGAQVSLCDGKYLATTDADGKFSIQIELADQREFLPVIIEAEGYEYFEEEETVGKDVKLILSRDSQ